MQTDARRSIEPEGELDQISIDRSLLDALHSKGLIGPVLWQDSLDWLHPSHSWVRWVMGLCVSFGSALVLSGIIFFFAFNWALLPDLVKLGFIQIGLVFAAMGAWIIGPHHLVGQMLLMAASVLVGVFWAVFGQVYQSGADAWSLFAFWTLLITPWAGISHSAFHWLLWLILFNIGLSLWWDQAIGSFQDKALFQFLLHAGVNVLFLLVREKLVRVWRPRCLVALWTRWLLLAVVLMAAFPILFQGLSNPFENWGVFCSAVVCLIGTGSMFVTYRKDGPDIAALSMICLLWSLLLVFLLVDGLNGLDMSNLWITLLSAVVTIAVFAASAGYLRHIAVFSERAQEEGGNG